MSVDVPAIWYCIYCGCLIELDERLLVRHYDPILRRTCPGSDAPGAGLDC